MNLARNFLCLCVISGDNHNLYFFKVFSGSDEASRHGRGVRDEGFETELLSGDAELNQFGFVHTDGVVVGLGRVSQRILEVLED